MLPDKMGGREMSIDITGWLDEAKFKVGDRVVACAYEGGKLYPGVVVGRSKDPSFDWVVDQDNGVRVSNPNSHLRLETWQDWPVGCWLECVKQVATLCEGYKYKIEKICSDGKLWLADSQVKSMGLHISCGYDAKYFRRCSPPERQWVEYVGDDTDMTLGKAYLKKPFLAGVISVTDDAGNPRACSESDFRDCDEPEKPKQWAKCVWGGTNLILGKIYEAVDGLSPNLCQPAWLVIDEQGNRKYYNMECFTPCEAPIQVGDKVMVELRVDRVGKNYMAEPPYEHVILREASGKWGDVHSMTIEEYQKCVAAGKVKP